MLHICRYFHSGHFVYQFPNKCFTPKIFCCQDHNSCDMSLLRGSLAPALPGFLPPWYRKALDDGSSELYVNMCDNTTVDHGNNDSGTTIY